MSDIKVYEPKVACMSYCYGGSVVLEADEYLDESDPLAVVKLSDHLEAVKAARVESYADGRVDGMRDVADLCYRRGLDKAGEAVAALVPKGYSPGFIAVGYVAGVRYSVEAIDALKGDN